MNPKLVKMTVYVIDFSDGVVLGEYDEFDNLKEYYENYIDVGLNRYNSMNASCHIEDFQEVEIEWDDDIDINQKGATREMYDRYF